MQTTSSPQPEYLTTEHESNGLPSPLEAPSSGEHWGEAVMTLTVAEAAKAADVTPATIRRWMKDGLSSRKVGRGTTVSSCALNEWNSTTARARRKACKALGISARTDLIYSAAPAAEAMGISVGMLRRHVEPAEYVENPYYENAGRVGLYDPVDLARALKRPAVAKARERYAARKAAAEKATRTRMANMEARMEEVEIKIVAGKTDEQIRELAVATHGGNYRGDPGPFHWSNRTARNCIRHNLTNYEQLWSICNRGYTGEFAYEILRDRVDELVVETYPQFASDEQVERPAAW